MDNGIKLMIKYGIGLKTIMDFKIIIFNQDYLWKKKVKRELCL
jgi:hypothetical protein